METTTTQKAYNNVAKRIEELTAMRPWTFGFAHGDLLKTISILENKLAEISHELTAERHANNY